MILLLAIQYQKHRIDNENIKNIQNKYKINMK